MVEFGEEVYVGVETDAYTMDLGALDGMLFRGEGDIRIGSGVGSLRCADDASS